MRSIPIVAWVGAISWLAFCLAPECVWEWVAAQMDLATWLWSLVPKPVDRSEK